MYISVWRHMSVYGAGVCAHRLMSSQKTEWGSRSPVVGLSGGCGVVSHTQGPLKMRKRSVTDFSPQPQYSCPHNNQNHLCKFMNRNFPKAERSRLYVNLWYQHTCLEGQSAIVGQKLYGLFSKETHLRHSTRFLFSWNKTVLTWRNFTKMSSVFLLTVENYQNKS